MKNRGITITHSIKFIIFLVVFCLIFLSTAVNLGAETVSNPEELSEEELEELEDVMEVEIEDIDLSELFSLSETEEDEFAPIENLYQIRDPFANLSEEDAEETEMEDLEDEELDPEEIPRPNFYVSGYSRRSDNLIITVNRGGDYFILSPGEKIDGYKFVDLRDREAIFTKEDREFNLVIGSEQE